MIDARRGESLVDLRATSLCRTHGVATGEPISVYTSCTEKGATLFTNKTLALLSRFFYNFTTVGNRNEYSTKQVQIVSLQPDYVSTW